MVREHHNGEMLIPNSFSVVTQGGRAIPLKIIACWRMIVKVDFVPSGAWR